MYNASDEDYLPHGNITQNGINMIMDYYAPSDYDMSLIPYPGIIKHQELWEKVTKIVFYVVIVTIAVVGNSMVVILVLKNKAMWTTTNFYIVNLAVSDLMVTLSCTWVTLVDDLSEGWILGAFFCRVNSFAQVLSLVSSILTLTLIACDRFFGIVFAMKAHLTERKAKVFIILIWVCSIGISTPLLVYRKQFTRQWLDHIEIWCDDTWPGITTVDSETGSTSISYPSRTLYYTFISLVLYFFPIVIMSFAYSFIIAKLWSNRQPGEFTDNRTNAQEKIKRKVVVMLLVILSVFAFCWLPFQISILYSEHRGDKHKSLPSWYAKFQFFATYIAYANSAINPVIYTSFNANFRRAFKETFGCTRGTWKHRYCSVELRRGGASTVYRNTSVSRI